MKTMSEYDGNNENWRWRSGMTERLIESLERNRREISERNKRETTETFWRKL